MTRQRGFTLLEVVVAFAILAMALGAVYEALTSSTRREAKVADQLPAIAIAESLLAEYSVDPPFSQSSVSGTEGRYHWAVITEPDGPTIANAGKVPVVRLTVNVLWGATVPQQKVQLTRLAIANRPVGRR